MTRTNKQVLTSIYSKLSKSCSKENMGIISIEKTEKKIVIPPTINKGIKRINVLQSVNQFAFKDIMGNKENSIVIKNHIHINEGVKRLS